MLAGVGLVMLYLGYSALTAPWLVVEPKQHRKQYSSATPNKSPAYSEHAKTWFREDAWVHNANARFGDGSRFLYFQKYELFNNDHSIRVDPIAMLWHADESEVPYALTARSAQLDATSPFRLDTNEFGAITSGQLQGDVRITGPDGFRLEGRTFSISDNAMKVTTSQPVKFWWGPHSGVAHSGAEIDLLASADRETRGLMSITDVQQVSLLGRIECELFFQSKDAKREAITLKINAANGFKFFIPTHQATFYGFSEQKIRKDNQILVERPTLSGGLDRLFCSMLTIQFQPEVIDIGVEKRSSPKLRLASIQAEGSRVVFDSREQNVIAVMNRLEYHVEEKVMELSGGVTLATGREKPVKIHQKSSMLTASYVITTHDSNNSIQSVECRGPGRIEPSDSPTAPQRTENHETFSATWAESLIMRQFPEKKITLTGAATVSQANGPAAEPGMSLSGDVIEMTGTQAMQTGNAHAVQAATSEKSEIDLDNITPKELEAKGNVIVTHNSVTGQIAEKLKVIFSEVPSGGDIPKNVRTVSQSTLSHSPTGGDQTTRFSCDNATANIGFTRLSSGKVHSDWDDVWLIGKVRIDRRGDAKYSEFSAEGNALSAKSGFSEVGDISLFGDPAKARLASHRIEGPQINLQELVNGETGVQRPITVPGSGSILFAVDQGFDGKTLQKPSLLEIYWTESMVYSDRTVSFVGNIRAVMTNDMDHKLELTCASMKVYLTQDPQLEFYDQKKNKLRASGSPTDPDKNPIERIECNSKVVVDIDQLKNGVVASRNHAEFSDLKVNMITGAFEATGSGSSGIIESTQPNSRDVPGTTPRAVARANMPVSTSSNAFVFVQARFIGGITGNYKERFVQLKQHVRGVFGPVRQLGDRIVLDDLNVNELPPYTGSMRCENLSFSQIDSDDDESQFEMVAESNSSKGSDGTHAPCHLESNEISGDADWIKYDSSKQQFILRAGQGRQATVFYRRSPGTPPDIYTGQQFEYYRESNELKGREITGVQTAGDLRAPGR